MSISITIPGTLHERYIQFVTSKIGSLNDKKYDGTNYTHSTFKIFDINGVEITDPANEGNATKSQLDFFYSSDYMIQSGTVSILNQPANPVYAYCIVAPDVPEQNGGSVVMISNLDLRHIGEKRLFVIDGKKEKYMKYDNVYYSSKIRIIIKHTAGEQNDIQVGLKIFLP